ncbi:MAG: hypothetical protein JO143_08375, partial [Acetobacteraceae bacterium]|nr:hypothetical protein [Acetobacteraceae bacterium]
MAGIARSVSSCEVGLGRRRAAARSPSRSSNSGAICATVAEAISSWSASMSSAGRSKRRAQTTSPAARMSSSCAVTRTRSAPCWIVPSGRKSRSRPLQAGLPSRGSAAIAASDELATHDTQRKGASAVVISSARPSDSPPARCGSSARSGMTPIRTRVPGGRGPVTVGEA